MPAFKRVYKKLHLEDKKKVNEAIKAIVHHPKMGEIKKGDLFGVFAYKFKINYREILVAYEWDAKQIILLAMGVHKNFYRDLQHFQKCLS